MHGAGQKVLIFPSPRFVSALTSPSLDGTFPPSHTMGKTNSTLNQGPASVIWVGFKAQRVWSLRTYLRTDWKQFCAFIFFPSFYRAEHSVNTHGFPTAYI